MWPDILPIRRAVWPLIEKYDTAILGHDIFAVAEIRPREFAGVMKKDVQATRKHLRSMSNIYPNNAAALKYMESERGHRVYEHGSYAYRPDGIFGKWQLHIRLFPHENGTALFTHWELNPLHSPRKHYGGVNLDDQKGVKKARRMFDLDEDATLDGIIYN